MFKPLLTLVFACAVSGMAFAAAPQMQLPPQPKTHPTGIPANFVMVTPCVQGMGEHWIDPKTAMLPDGVMGPIYGSYQGKAIFSEIMVPKSVFAKGFNYKNLLALPGYTINHIDVAEEPKGHEGMPVPHYDVHAYYVTHAEHIKYCPNGIPDPSRKD